MMNRATDRDWYSHLVMRRSRHDGGWHDQCRWDRPTCIEARLADPGMHNEVELRHPFASEAYLHLHNLIESAYPGPYVPESLFETGGRRSSGIG